MTEVCCLDYNGVNHESKGLTERTKELVQEWLGLDRVRDQCHPLIQCMSGVLHV